MRVNVVSTKVGIEQMKYSDYKRSYSALRRVLRENEQYGGHFSKFNMNMGSGLKKRKQRGIWSARTENVVAVINRKGTVFVRPNSIFAEALKGSSHKVLFKDNLVDFRGQANSNVRRQAVMSSYAEKAVRRLIENNDKPNNVYLFSFLKDINIDVYFLISRLEQLLQLYARNNYENTKRSVTYRALKFEDDYKNNKIKAYVDVTDWAEKIALEKLREKAKVEIIRHFVENKYAIVRQSILNRRSVNPIEFEYIIEDKHLYGTIMAQYIEFSVSDELLVEYVKEAIAWRDEPYSPLHERPEYHELERSRQMTANNTATLSYSEYASCRVSIPIPTEWVATDTPFGTTFSANPMYVDEAQGVSEADVRNIVTPTPNIFDDEIEADTFPY